MSVVVEDKEPVQEETQETQETQEPQFEVPKKFQGKSQEEIIQSYLELEKELGRQGQEMGEIRKLADSLIQKEMNQPQGTKEQKEELDFYEQPEKAVESVVERKLREQLEPLNKQVSESKRDQFLNQLKQKYPEVEDVVKDPEFGRWVSQSKARMYLAQEADKHDLESADELLRMWQSEHGEQRAEEKEARKQKLRDATTEKGSTGQGSKKVYRRQELLKMRMNDPDKYDSMYDEIAKAYKEGRVK